MLRTELALGPSIAYSTTVFVRGGQALVTYPEQEPRARGCREQEVAAETGNLSTWLPQVLGGPLRCPDGFNEMGTALNYCKPQ